MFKVVFAHDTPDLRIMESDDDCLDRDCPLNGGIFLTMDLAKHFAVNLKQREGTSLVRVYAVKDRVYEVRNIPPLDPPLMTEFDG